MTSLQFEARCLQAETLAAEWADAYRKWTDEGQYSAKDYLAGRALADDLNKKAKAFKDYLRTMNTTSPPLDGEAKG